VLNTIGPLYEEVVTAPDPERTKLLLSTPRYWPWFGDCVGAMDGTYIPMSIKYLDKVDKIVKIAYRNRKGGLS
jgi:hypothetical protein